MESQPILASGLISKILPQLAETYYLLNALMYNDRSSELTDYIAHLDPFAKDVFANFTMHISENAPAELNKVLSAIGEYSVTIATNVTHPRKERLRSISDIIIEKATPYSGGKGGQLILPYSTDPSAPYVEKLTGLILKHNKGDLTEAVDKAMAEVELDESRRLLQCKVRNAFITSERRRITGLADRVSKSLWVGEKLSEKRRRFKAAREYDLMVASPMLLGNISHELMLALISVASIGGITGLDGQDLTVNHLLLGFEEDIRAGKRLIERIASIAADEGYSRSLVEGRIKELRQDLMADKEAQKAALRVRLSFRESFLQATGSDVRLDSKIDEEYALREGYM